MYSRLQPYVLQADTKMLRAGWGSWGAPASRATISSEMMAGAEWAGRSGEGFGSRREVANPRVDGKWAWRT